MTNEINRKSIKTVWGMNFGPAGLACLVKWADTSNLDLFDIGGDTRDFVLFFYDYYESGRDGTDRLETVRMHRDVAREAHAAGKADKVAGRIGARA